MYHVFSIYKNILYTHDDKQEYNKNTWYFMYYVFKNLDFIYHDL